LGCLKLTYQTNSVLRIVSSKKDVTSNKSVLNLRSAYLYGFNGMEKDTEVKGGNSSHYTTPFRQYDPRIGRWMSLDPLMAKFPHMSPYVAFDNNPIYFSDPWGLEPGNKDDECNESCSDDNYDSDGNWVGTDDVEVNGTLLGEVEANVIIDDNSEEDFPGDYGSQGSRTSIPIGTYAAHNSNATTNQVNKDAFRLVSPSDMPNSKILNERYSDPVSYWEQKPGVTIGRYLELYSPYKNPGWIVGSSPIMVNDPITGANYLGSTLVTTNKLTGIFFFIPLINTGGVIPIMI